jgi:hypothetical protein
VIKSSMNNFPLNLSFIYSTVKVLKTVHLNSYLFIPINKTPKVKALLSRVISYKF